MRGEEEVREGGREEEEGVLHDATKNIDKDGSDLLVSVEQFERLLNLLLSRTATNIQKVRWIAAVELWEGEKVGGPRGKDLDDIHSGHG
jgi:hypothetical protein